MLDLRQSLLKDIVINIGIFNVSRDMSSFPVSAKKIAIIFLLVVLLLSFGVALWIVVMRIQAKDPLKYMGAQNLVGIVEIHNTEKSAIEWKRMGDRYVSQILPNAILGSSKEEAETLLKSLPEASYFIAYKDAGIFIFHEGTSLTQKKLEEALRKNFTVLLQDGFVLVSSVSQEILKDHIASKDNKKISDILSTSAFDSTSMLSFATVGGVALSSIGDLLVAQNGDVSYQVFVRDILSQVTAPRGNIHITQEGFLSVSGTLKAPKDELKYFVKKDMLSESVLSQEGAFSSLVAFVVEPNIIDSFSNYFKEQKSESFAKSWMYLVNAVIGQARIIDELHPVVQYLEKSSLSIGFTASGKLVANVANLQQEKMDSLMALFKKGVEKNMAYEEVSTILPDKTKAQLLERHPEEVSLLDKSASGSYLKEIHFRDAVKLRVREGSSTIYSIDDGTSDVVNNTSSQIVNNYFTDPVQWFVKTPYVLPAIPSPYVNEVLPQKKGSLYLSITTFTDGLTYKILFVPDTH